MTAVERRAVESSEAFLSVLPAGQSWRRVMLMARGPLDPAARSLATLLAHRDGASLIVYDAGGDSFWASPFPPGEGIRSPLLAEADLRRVGRIEVADALREMGSDGTTVLAHVSTVRHGEDVPRVVSMHGVDLLICPVPVAGRLGQFLTEARHAGAALLECEPGKEPIFNTPLENDDRVPAETRVQFRFLVALLLTFFAAGFRNRTRA